MSKVCDDLLKDLPIYHTQAMRLEFIQSFGKVTGKVDDRRHDNVGNDTDGNQEIVTHLAIALSISDLHNKFRHASQRELQYLQNNGYTIECGLEKFLMQFQDISRAD